MSTTALARSPSPASPSPTSAPVLLALTQRAEQALQHVTESYRAFVSNRTAPLHGSLALAVAHAQQLLKALESVREQRERQRQQQQSHSTRRNTAVPGSFSGSSSPSTASPAPSPTSADLRAPTKEELSLHMRVDKVRIDLRRALPRAVAAVEDADAMDGSSGSSRSAASTAAALRSLLHTRSMLSVELQKMDTAVQGIAGSGESLAALHHSLEDVHTSMATAQLMVRKLLTVQSRDDLILRVSALLFALVVLYVIAQRVFRFFPATVYVTMSDEARGNGGGGGSAW